VRICTPYFLPDRSLRRALIDAARRGVKIAVIVPGRATDQRWVRLVSRRMYGSLLQHEVRIFEYDRSMTHVKALVVDGLWAVLGTTNIDNRSFEHNDELNVAMRNESVAARVMEDYARDVEASTEITLETWRRRPLWEKLFGVVAWILERQQ
jgi:cardiolipin synthase